MPVYVYLGYILRRKRGNLGSVRMRPNYKIGLDFRFSFFGYSQKYYNIFKASSDKNIIIFSDNKTKKKKTGIKSRFHFSFSIFIIHKF